MEQIDNNLYVKTIRDIKEGEELFIDYFRVYEYIDGENTRIIEEVLRWTEGYDDLEIPSDSHKELRGESWDLRHGLEDVIKEELKEIGSSMI